jgi:hypothetical protein
VFLCGPPGLVRAAEREARRAGATVEKESFEL